MTLRRRIIALTTLGAFLVGCGGVQHSDTRDWAATDTTPVERSSGWVPVDCPEGLQANPPAPASAGSLTAKYEAGVPYPDPSTFGEVIEDFEHGYFGLFMRRAPAEDDPERPIYDALLQDEVTFDVRQVVDWGSGRCARGEKPYYFAVRVLDQAGEEVARSMVHAAGRIGTYSGGGPGRRLGPPPEPEEAADLLAPLGVRAPRDAQLAGLDGLHGRCARSRPCLVARAAGSIWVIYPGDGHGSDARGTDPWIYEIPSDAERFTPTEAGQMRLRGQAGLMNLCCSDLETPLLSIGHAFARARLRSGPDSDDYD